MREDMPSASIVQGNWYSLSFLTDRLYDNLRQVIIHFDGVDMRIINESFHVKDQVITFSDEGLLLDGKLMPVETLISALDHKLQFRAILDEKIEEINKALPKLSYYELNRLIKQLKLLIGDW